MNRSYGLRIHSICELHEDPLVAHTYLGNKMTVPLSNFKQYKLITSELCGTYCIQTIPSESGPTARTEKWIRGRTLGQGGFGTVWLGEEEKGALRAVKQISKIHTVLTSRELLALSTLKEVGVCKSYVAEECGIDEFQCLSAYRTLCAVFRMV